MKNNNRDNFKSTTIERAAKRVGYRCSFPNCDRPTIGASNEGDDKTSNIGVAAHICAAASGGKRYDSTMTESERKSISNCIWLCQNHAKLIDNDEIFFTKEKLLQYKKVAEEKAKKSLATSEFILRKNEGSEIRIVDVGFCEEENNVFLDVKIRNIGDTVAFLKKVIFDIEFSYSLLYDESTQFQLIESTATYDIILNRQKKQIFDISQSVQANNVDRFKLKIASSVAEPRLRAIYVLNLSFEYNEDCEIRFEKKLIAVLPSTQEWAACSTFGFYEQENINRNYQALIEANTYQGIKSKLFLNLLERYEIMNIEINAISIAKEKLTYSDDNGNTLLNEKGRKVFESSKIAIKQLLDPTNNENIILYDGDSEIEFEQIALIPIDNEVYVILKPISNFDLEEDEAICFQIIDIDDDNYSLNLVIDESLMDKIFEAYEKLFNNEND